MEPANAADRKSIRRQEKASRLADAQRREVITQIMSHPSGRAWLWDTLSKCSIFSTTHVPGDALASSFQEGRRSMGLDLLSDIMAHCPDQFVQAMREQNERHIAADRADPNARSDADNLGLDGLGGPGDPTDPSTGRDIDGAGPDPEPGDDAPDGWRTLGADIYVEDRPGGQTN